MFDRCSWIPGGCWWTPGHGGVPFQLRKPFFFRKDRFPSAKNIDFHRFSDFTSIQTEVMKIIEENND